VNLLSRIRFLIQEVFAAVFFDHALLDKLFFESLDLDDVFKDALVEFGGPNIKVFKSCMTADEYNKELHRIFYSHRRDFFSDNSYKDGHFRV